MAKAVDMGDYYRIPCDTRDLNYDKFFTEGNEDIARIEDYHSHNTARLDVEGMKSFFETPLHPRRPRNGGKGEERGNQE